MRGELIPVEAAKGPAVSVAYRRTGRKLNGRGRIVGVYANGSVRIQPDRRGWRQVIVSPGELNAGKGITVTEREPECHETELAMTTPAAPGRLARLERELAEARLECERLRALLCRVRLPVGLRLTAALAREFPGTRMRKVGEHLEIFSEHNTNDETPWTH
jgi:hypothetical protein